MTATMILVLAAAAVLATAVISSLLTLALAARLIERRYRVRLDQEKERFLAALGDTVEQRVRQGVVDGIKSLPSPEMVRWTREAVTDAAGELVRGGLSSLLGDRKK
jgi:hypothetical protein